MIGGGLEVVGQAEIGQRVDNKSGDAVFGAQFGRSVVPREGVVIIMPTLSNRNKCDEARFHRFHESGKCDQVENFKTVFFISFCYFDTSLELHMRCYKLVIFLNIKSLKNAIFLRST